MAEGGFVATVSARGRVSLLKAIRDALGWRAGTRLVVERTSDGVLLRPAAPVFAPTRPEDVFGCLAYSGKAKTVEEMDPLAGCAGVRRG